MYTAREENYRRMKEICEKFEQGNFRLDLYDIVANDAGKYGFDQTTLARLERLFEIFWETLKIMSNSYLTVPCLYPDTVSKKFIQEFESVVDLIFGFKNRHILYNDFINHISNPEKSILFEEFNSLFIAWGPIASSTVTEKIKKMEEDLARHNRDNIDKGISSLNKEFETKKGEMETLLKNGKAEILETQRKLNINGTKEALNELAASVKKKKRSSIWVLGWLSVGLVVAVIISYCVNGYIFDQAAKMPSNLSMIYVLKGTLPFFAIFSVLSYFIISQFKLVKSYLHLVETYQFKSSLIDNMIGLMGDKYFNDAQKAIIITKLIDSIISFSSSGILDSKQENKDDIQSMMVQMMGMMSKSQS